jgi:hypothetical protein
VLEAWINVRAARWGVAAENNGARAALRCAGVAESCIAGPARCVHEALRCGGGVQRCAGQ